MLYGIFADIHSNKEALDAVLEFLDEKKVDAYLCLGDLVGYGADPEACIRKVMSLEKLTIVAGNHDLALAGMKDWNWFNEYAQVSLEINKKLISDSARRYLRSLPTMFSNSQMTLVHGSPRDSTNEYLVSLGQFRENLYHLDTPLCFIGHTHIPTLFISDAGKYFYSFIPIEGEKIKIRAQHRIIANVGSVGQPRDCDFRAACALYDTKSNEITINRVEYDVPAAQRKMRKLKLPAFLIERLLSGR